MMGFKRQQNKIKLLRTSTKLNLHPHPHPQKKNDGKRLVYSCRGIILKCSLKEESRKKYIIRFYPVIIVFDIDGADISFFFSRTMLQRCSSHHSPYSTRHRASDNLKFEWNFLVILFFRHNRNRSDLLHYFSFFFSLFDYFPCLGSPLILHYVLEKLLV